MEVDDDSNVDSGKVLTALAIALFGVLKQEKTMNVEYYKDAQNIAQTIHDYRWNTTFENDNAKAQAEKEVRAKYIDFVNKWFDAVCDERKDYEGDDGLDEALTTIHIDVSERLTWIFNEMIYQRRREQNKRRATELLVE